MQIARFGDTWAGGYAFPTYKAEDDYGATRPPIQQPVGGAGGAFDFLGEYAYPIAPLTVKKTFYLKAASYAAIEDDLSDLRLATILAQRSKLWALLRDGTTVYWAYAKCIALEAAESYQEKAFVTKKVTLQFNLPEGVWYAEDAVTDDFDIGPGSTYNAWSSVPGPDPLVVLTTPLSIAITNSGCTTNSLTIRVCDGGGATIYEVIYTGAVVDGTTLIIDAAAYSVQNNGVDDYAHLTVGSGQTLWLGMLPTDAQRIYVYRDVSTGTTHVEFSYTPMVLL